jgi:hypothetical protein
LELRLSSDQDNVWKEIIDAYFPEFIAFFFPQVYPDIAWAKGYEYLDKELGTIVKDGEVGTRFADKLVKVFLIDGKETWLMLHIEVQGYYDPDFAKRMYIYNYRIFDFYNKEVVSLALLTDSNRKYRPNEYKFAKWGFERSMKFPMVKLIDYNKDWVKLEADPNPFAMVVMAQLKAIQIKKPTSRLVWKLKLYRMLNAKGYSKEEARNLFRFLDWIMRLPKDLEIEFKEEVDKSGGITMPYVTSIERLTMVEILIISLEEKFGGLDATIKALIYDLEAEELKTLAKKLIFFKDISELVSWLKNNQPEK